MVLEVAWFRLLGLAMGPTVYVFSAMLGTFLLGVGAGSAAFAGWARGTRLGGVGAFAALEALLGIGVLGSLWLLNELPRWNAIFYLRTSELLDERAFAISHVLLAAVVVLPPCLVMGALFPTAVRAIRESGHDGAPEANVGRLYLLNTLGGIAGSLVAGFVLLPAFGLTRTLAGSGIASVAIGAALWIRGGAARKVAG